MAGGAPVVIVTAERTETRNSGGREMEPHVISAEELEHGDREARVVHRWRIEQLKRLGLPYVLADLLADRLDWHALEDLVERGCPLHLALEIVI
jgi:hypothetical protein